MTRGSSSDEEREFIAGLRKDRRFLEEQICKHPSDDLADAYRLSVELEQAIIEEKLIQAVSTAYAYAAALANAKMTAYVPIFRTVGRQRASLPRASKAGGKKRREKGAATRTRVLTAYRALPTRTPGHRYIAEVVARTGLSKSTVTRYLSKR